MLFRSTKEDWAKESVEPTLMYRAHSAPLMWQYYTGSQFPAEYKNDAFVAMRGSWNRVPASGHEVVRVRFNADGTPASITPFLTGFLVKDPKQKGEAQCGRPVGVAQMKDGSLLIGDDTNNTIYRISYAENMNGGNRASEMRRDWALERTISTDLLKAPKGLEVRSEAFAPGAMIPVDNTAYGANVSPALTLSGIPENAKSLVLMMEDPDSLAPKPYVHWIAANLPPDLREIPANLAKTDRPTALRGGIQGGNTTGKVGYFGPQTPPQDPPHRYHFQFFALDTMLDLKPGYNRAALLKAMQGHVLSSGLIVGKFVR